MVEMDSTPLEIPGAPKIPELDSCKPDFENFRPDFCKIVLIFFRYSDPKCITFRLRVYPIIDRKYPLPH